MGDGFFVSINNQTVYECNETRHPARLRRHLDEVEMKMDQGIQLAESWIETPDEFQKLQYAAMILIDALEKQNDNLVNLMSAYLATRDPGLKEIRATSNHDVFNFSLIQK